MHLNGFRGRVPAAKQSDSHPENGVVLGELRETLLSRYRWPLILVSVGAGVLATVLLYNVTSPKPEQVGGVDVKELPEAQILRVGALPVT